MDWLRAALWTVWRCGVPEISNEALGRFRKTLGISWTEFLERLTKEDLVEVVPRHDGFKAYTFLKLTDKGRELVYQDEAARWAEKLREMVLVEPGGTPKRAYDLARTMTLKDAGKTLKLSRERVRCLKEQHIREMLRYQDRMEERRKFLAGERAFQDLRLEILGRLSVRTLNVLENAEIRTVAKLLETTAGYLMRRKNFGRKMLKEINAKLKEFGAAPLALEYWDLNRFVPVGGNSSK